MSPSRPARRAPEPALPERLDSWKEIAVYLKRSVRTVKRWEREGLPVHRHLHASGSTVFAYKGELDGWWNERRHPFAAGPNLKVVTAGVLLVVAALAGGYWLIQARVPANVAGPLSPVSERSLVLVAGLDDHTGESLPLAALGEALDREIGAGAPIAVTPRERIDGALRLMRRPPTTRVDVALAREICLRDGAIQGVLTGWVSRHGGSYVLTVDIVDPVDGATLVRLTEQAPHPQAVLSAILRLAGRLRTEWWKTLGALRPGHEKLARVTTSSLEALRLYTKADRMIEESKSPVAEELLRRAVQEDPEFASAFLHLAWALYNQDRPEREWRPPAEKALRLADAASDGERYFIHASYHHLLGRTEKAIANYEALLSVDPSHRWGWNNLSILYARRGRRSEGVEFALRRAQREPESFEANAIAAFKVALDQYQPRVAEPYLHRAQGLLSEKGWESLPWLAGWMELFPASMAWLRGDLEVARARGEAVMVRLDSLSGRARDSLSGQVTWIDLALGRMEAAARKCAATLDLGLRHDCLSRVAFLNHDQDALREHLRTRTRLKASPGAIAAILLARAGLLSESHSMVREIGKDPDAWEPGYHEIVQGELALAEGRPNAAIAHLTKGLELGQAHALWPFFLGSESLGDALWEKGDRQGALGVLERASGFRPTAAVALSGAFWLRTFHQQARLYRKLGRDEEASSIEEELRGLLRLADPTHPILMTLATGSKAG